MGTRGAVGVRVDGQDKVTYNHCDSYPEGLGQAIVDELAALLREGIEPLRQRAREIRLIDSRVPPTPEDKKRLAPFADLGVSNRTLDDWYCLLRNLQGGIAGYLQCGVMADNHAFLADSVACEWAYVVNLDEETFEVYRGFQDEPHDKGRYAKLPRADDVPTKYEPVALVGSFPLAAIPEDWKQVVDPVDPIDADI